MTKTKLITLIISVIVALGVIVTVICLTNGASKKPSTGESSSETSQQPSTGESSSETSQQNFTPYEYFTFTKLFDGTYRITVKNKTDLPSKVVLPSSYNETAITTIGNKAFKDCTNLTEIEIPNSVTSIGNNAFYGCSSLTSVTIPGSVTSIGDSAFYGCYRLTSATIGSGVTSIGNNAFEFCTGLTKIEIPDSVTFIGIRAFYNCGKLELTTEGNLTYLGNSNNPYLYLNRIDTREITSANINSKCKFIASSAFYYCNNMTEIVIPNSVTSIGNQAFTGCSELKTVYYNGTEEEWNKIAIDNTDDCNSTLINTARYYYSETEPTTDGNYWRYVNGVPTPWVKP